MTNSYSMKDNDKVSVILSWLGREEKISISDNKKNLKQAWGCLMS